jgi:hypothetical protein
VRYLGWYGFGEDADEDSPKDAVLSLIKRLAHRNANVQLYTLEVCYMGLA